MKASAAALALLLPPAAAAQTVTWDAKLYDPAGGADLMLPMPCGGGMAFQKIVTPVAPDDPLDDRRLRLGAGDPQTGFVDYLRQEFLRGAFTDAATGETVFYVARYELTKHQAQALRGDCPTPDLRGAVPETGLSWFDAMDLARRHTEWLRANAPGALPAEQGVPGFVRLPTETEWEYAARGGAKVSPTEFEARLPSMEGALKDVAWHQGAESARGQFRPVGRLKPNPAGLHDIFGNVEELMLEPFRLNNLGRPGGQVGGIVTRGGSIYSDPGAIYSAQRQEWSPYDTQSGKAQAQESFGARFVIGAHVTLTLDRINEIRRDWLERSGATPEQVADPLGQLGRIIEEETQPARKAALEAVRGEFLAAERIGGEARLEALKSTVFAGAVQIVALVGAQDRIDDANLFLSDYRSAEQQARAAGNAEDATFYGGEIPVIEAALARHRESYELTARAFERLLVSAASPDYAPSLRRQARDVLEAELEAAGLGSMLPRVRAFATAAETYSSTPGMSLESIIESVIAR